MYIYYISDLIIEAYRITPEKLISQPAAPLMKRKPPLKHLLCVKNIVFTRFVQLLHDKSKFSFLSTERLIAWPEMNSYCHIICQV